MQIQNLRSTAKGRYVGYEKTLGVKIPDVSTAGDPQHSGTADQQILLGDPSMPLRIYYP